MSDSEADESLYGASSNNRTGAETVPDGPFEVAMLPNEPATLDLPFYDLDTMLHPDATLLIVGMRGSGKTTFMRNVMYSMRHTLDMAVFMCPSADVRDEFRQFLPSSFIYDFDAERLATIVNAQGQLAAEAGSSKFDSLRRVGIILDDCMFDAKYMRSKTMRNIIMNGRHNRFFFMNCTQHAPDFPKGMRGNLDTIVVFPPANDEVFDTVYKNLLSGAFQSRDECRAAFDSLQAHECLVYDPKAQTRKLPFIYYCKARPKLPRFRVGCDAFWELHYTYFKRPPSQAVAIANAVAVAKGMMVPRPMLKVKNGHGGEDGGFGGVGGSVGIVVKRGPAPGAAGLVFGAGVSAAANAAKQGLGRAIGAAAAAHAQANAHQLKPKRRRAKSADPVGFGNGRPSFFGNTGGNANYPMLAAALPIVPHSLPPAPPM
jgi:hypothetical protein